MLKFYQKVSLWLICGGVALAVSPQKAMAVEPTIPESIAPQQKTVKVVVKDEKGEPIVGALVSIIGTTSGGITEGDGATNIKAAPGTALEISYLGYKPQTVRTSSADVLNVIMAADAINVGDVVVIGYGTERKSDLTGAISSVKFDDTPVNTFGSISQALAGKAAGLSVSTISAQPGGKTNFNIRGAASTGAGNDPLIIIDGFPVSGSSEPGSGNRYEGGPKDNVLATLNPNDIESISILKDASATAIYGSRAGHGVIIVTTKRGKEGRVNVTYSGNVGFQTHARTYDMFGASEFMTQANNYDREVYLRTEKMYPYGVNAVNFKGFDPRFSDQMIANPVNDVNWYDEVTRNGFQQQHSLSMSGGTQKTQYLVSLNYYDQKGAIKNNDMDRFNARVNLDQKIGKYFKAGINLTFNRNKFDNVAIGSGQNENAGVIVSAMQFSPITPVRDSKGNYALNNKAAYIPNPVSLLEITDKSNLQRLLSTAYVELNPLEGLVFKLTGGLDRNYNKRTTYVPKTTLYGQKTAGEANISQNDKHDYLIELTGSYNKKIKKHSFGVLLGYSFQDFNSEGFNAGNSNFLIDGFLFNNIGAGQYEKPWVGSWASKSQMASLFARANYNYDDRYYITATFRRDGASNLAEGNQWGNFPSVALSWRLSQEKFMESSRKILSNAKIRLSYGQTGNSNIGNKARDYYNIWGSYIFGGNEYKGVGIGQLGNPKLTWETTSEFNLGIDLEFVGRVGLSAEFYSRVISDLLSTRSLMSYQEVDNIADNIGKTQSRGFELTINSRNIVKPNFTWSTDLTFSLYRDRWKERSSTWKPAIYESTTDYLRSYFGYKSDGLIGAGETVPHMKGALPGMVKLQDIDGYLRDDKGNTITNDDGLPIRSGQPDGKLDNADKVLLGTSDPGYLFGMNNTFTYKNFDLSFYIYGVANKYTDGSYQDWSDYDRIVTDYNQPKKMATAWRSDNTDTQTPTAFQRESAYGAGDYFVQKMWYLRFRNITLGYNIPTGKASKVISACRVYFDVNNPFLFTNYKGIDPETDGFAGGISAYPNVRTYSIGLSISF